MTKSKIPTAGEKLADLKRCVNALSGLGRGHADIDDCYVGTVIFDGPHEQRRIVGLCDGFDACWRSSAIAWRIKAASLARTRRSGMGRASA